MLLPVVSPPTCTLAVLLNRCVTATLWTFHAVDEEAITKNQNGKFVLGGRTKAPKVY